jgi:hypothetical protein
MMQLQEALDDFEAATRLQSGEPYLRERKPPASAIASELPSTSDNPFNQKSQT